MTSSLECPSCGYPALTLLQKAIRCREVLYTCSHCGGSYIIHQRQTQVFVVLFYAALAFAHFLLGGLPGYDWCLFYWLLITAVWGEVKPYVAPIDRKSRLLG